jgi:hypothetical protein
MVEMTDLLSRPVLRVPTADTSRARPGVLMAVLGGAAVAVAGLLLFAGIGAVGWFAADTGTFGQAMSVASLAWLLGNGAGLAGGVLTITAVPLGCLLVCGYALYRVGRWLAASEPAVLLPRDAAVRAAAMAAGYGVIGALSAALTHAGGVHASLPRACLTFVAMGGAFGGLGLARGSAGIFSVMSRLPEEVRAALSGGAAAILAMLCASALALAASLTEHTSNALRLAEGLHSGIVGGAILALVAAALVPNAVLYAGAFLAGPGFALGSGTTIAPGGVHVGLLPDFPLLAAVPTSDSSRWMPALILVPVLAGGVAGAVAVRRYPVFGVDHVALRGGLAGLTGGVGFGIVTAAAAGSIGPGRLQDAGPDVLATTAVCAVAFLLGGVLVPVGARFFGGTFGATRRRWSGLRAKVRARNATTKPSPAGEQSFVMLADHADDEPTQPVRLDLPRDGG